MAQLVIRNATTLSGKRRSLVAEDGLITEMKSSAAGLPESDRRIDAGGMLLLPGFCNSHTHAPMSLLRGMGEGLELDEWLKDVIWPMESMMGLPQLEAGMALGCLEMIRSGTTLFNDMYFMEGELASVVSRMGLRAVLGEGFIDLFDGSRLSSEKAKTLHALSEIGSLRDRRITGALTPHAVYTVSEEGLSWCRDEAERRSLPLHIHLSETGPEVQRSIAKYGRSPPELLSGLGLLGKRTIAAHSVHLSERDMALLAESGCSVSNVPCSNMKLSVGGQMDHPRLRAKGILRTLGTDGAASNNSLDMFMTMRAASLITRNAYGASSISPLEILEMATSNGYRALGLDGGRLEVGCLADLILVDHRHVSMVPGNDVASDLVHSAVGDTVRYTIVGGRVLMDDRRVKREQRIKEDAFRMAEHLREGG